MKKFFTSRRIKLILVLLVVLAVPSYFYLKKPNQKTATARLAEISFASGQVEKSKTPGIWQETKSNDGIAEQESLRVSGDGRAIITLDDGSAIRLNSDSTVKLVSLDPNNIKITNERGEVYTRVVKLDRPFVVTVEDEEFQSLGTAYKTVNKEKEKGVLVYQSKVKLNKNKTEVPEGKKIYTKNEKADLANKILDVTTEEIEKDQFVQWNKEEDLKNTEFKDNLGVLVKKTTENPTPPPAPPTTPDQKITLSGSATEKGITFKWTPTGVDTSKGFKLVKGTKTNPVYPGNSATFISASARTYTWSITDGGTYNFRICQYTGSGCGVYSNNIVVTAPKVAVAEPKTPTGYTKAKVSWTVNESGHTISMNTAYTLALVNDYLRATYTPASWPTNGFKLVWSKNPNPTYPTRNGDKYNYYSDPATRYGLIDAFSGAGTYYVRICEYLGGSCGVYSNEIQVNIN